MAKKGKATTDDGTKKPRRKGCLIVVAILFTMAVIGTIMGGGSHGDTSTTNDGSTQTQTSSGGSTEDGASSSKQVNASEVDKADNTGTDNDNPAESAQQEVLFDGDESVNELLNEYNVVNPDDAITPGEFSAYHHHGSEHTNQAIDYDRNSFEIVVTNGTEVYIQAYQSNKTADETKAEAFKWIRALYPNVTDDDIETAWSEMESDLTNNVRIKAGGLDGMELDVTYQYERSDEEAADIQYLTIQKH